jgi:hypothetical protein
MNTYGAQHLPSHYPGKKRSRMTTKIKVPHLFLRTGSSVSEQLFFSFFFLPTRARRRWCSPPSSSCFLSGTSFQGQNGVAGIRRMRRIVSQTEPFQERKPWVCFGLVCFVWSRRPPHPDMRACTQVRGTAWFMGFL